MAEFRLIPTEEHELRFERFEIEDLDAEELRRDPAGYVRRLCEEADIAINGLQVPVHPMERDPIILHGIGNTNFSQILIL